MLGSSPHAAETETGAVSEHRVVHCLGARFVHHLKTPLRNTTRCDRRNGSRTEKNWLKSTALVALVSKRLLMDFELSLQSVSRFGERFGERCDET